MNCKLQRCFVKLINVLLLIGILQVSTFSGIEAFSLSPRRQARFSYNPPSTRLLDTPDGTGDEKPIRFYLDISVAGESIGRLVFCLPRPRSLFPQHTENILKLVEGSSVGLDPRLSYKNCEFQYSPQFIESFPQYRWAHNLPGRGRNAVGRAEDKITEVASLQSHTYRLYGGIYYGLEYSSSSSSSIIPEDHAGILTIPMTGPQRGSTGLSIVRVADSPPEWKERLLLNSAVLGWLEPESASTLQAFQQTRGPPTVQDCGIL